VNFHAAALQRRDTGHAADGDRASQPMKILLVHNTYQQAGGEDVVFEQEKKNLQRAGHHVATYERSNHEMEQFSTLQRAMLIKRIVWATDSRQEFAQLLARETPDVVHVHNTFIMISPSIYSACRDQGVPVVQTLQNYRLMCPGALFFRDGRVCEDCVEHSLWRGIQHGCYRGSHIQTAGVALMLAWHRQLKTYQELVDCSVAATEFSRGKFVAAGFDADKIVVKPNFVDQDPGPRKRVGDYAVFAGRLSQEKGVTTLLEAWEHVHRDYTLRIVGDGPLRAGLETQAKDRGLSNVTFCGRLSREGSIATVKGARFQITPSLWYEGFPMVIVEAFACGVPVLCSRLGGMQEIVADADTGLHFNPGDAQDLARKVEWAWNHPEELAEMGRVARRKYETDYTAEKNYSLLMKIYEDTVASYA
jgi:glycosyltransferase involved in cell wall biosynthesis